MPTAERSTRWRFPQTGPRLSQDRTTRRSKSGIWVRLSPQNRPSLAKTDACWLVWQSHWGCWARRRTHTAARSTRWRFPRTGPRSCLHRTTRRSKSGIWVRLGALKVAPPWPKLTPPGLSGRQTGAVEREDERAQRLRQVGGVLPGRDQDCVWIGRLDDQSLGFGCAAPSNRLSLAETDAVLACLADKLEMLSEKMNAHSDWVMSVAFSPDGTKIVSGSADETIKVWDSGAPRALKIALPPPKLTLARLPGRQAGDVE
jgi:hypothetical protein